MTAGEFHRLDTGLLHARDQRGEARVELVGERAARTPDVGHEGEPGVGDVADQQALRARVGLDRVDLHLARAVEHEVLHRLAQVLRAKRAERPVRLPVGDRRVEDHQRVLDHHDQAVVRAAHHVLDARDQLDEAEAAGRPIEARRLRVEMDADELAADARCCRCRPRNRLPR
jgi:hypothetical protein